MVTGLILAVFYLFSDFFYWAKWISTMFALQLRKTIHRRRFDLYDYDAETQTEKLGVLCPEEEKILESPLPEEHLQNAADEIFMYGINSKSESFVVRVTRAPNDEAEAWIYLKLKDGRWYQLQETAGYQRNYGGNCTSFTCGGLQMYYLSPMRRWRIVYCGMLREGNEKGENKDRRDVFVKFTFLWNASSDVFDFSTDVDMRATADAVAQAKWTSLIPPVDKVSEIMNFYSQSGVIFGTVSIEEENDIEIYLFGERVRYLGNSSCSVGCKFKHILGITPETGLVVHLGKASVPHAIQNLYFGFIVHPDSSVRVIEDGIIISRMSGKGEAREDLTAMVKAGRQYELKGNFLGDGVRFTSEQGWNGHLELIGIEFEIDGVKGSGFMMSGEILKVPERKSQKIPPVLPSYRPLTVFFYDQVSHMTDLTGGKGASLGMLTKLSKEMGSEFIVPKGIVVTTSAYKEFLTDDILCKIDKLKDIAYGNTEGNVQETCKIVSKAVEQARMPNKITKEVEEKLGKIFGGKIDKVKVAVRSSATGEDTDQMSAAGQMDTFLGVRGMKEILTAVTKCWASQFAYIATEYKSFPNGIPSNQPLCSKKLTVEISSNQPSLWERNGDPSVCYWRIAPAAGLLKDDSTRVRSRTQTPTDSERPCPSSSAIIWQNGQILNSPMAVVIQEMVECETAGVLFTCDPVTNNPSVAVITGNYGLGESVVSGAEEPDTVVLKKLPKRNVEIKSVTVGLKHHRIVLRDTKSENEDTVITEDVPEDKRKECCISEDMALRLGRLSLKIEDYFKSPRDIEWGIKNNTIYILQSRPITTGASASDYEIKHEFDGPLRCEKDCYTVANVGEVMPRATSPLGIDVFNRYFAIVFHKKDMKKRQQNTFMQYKYFPQGLVPFCNHLTMGVVDLLTRVGDTDSMDAQSMMIGIFGRLLDDPDLKVMAQHKEVQKRKATLTSTVTSHIETVKNLLFPVYAIEKLKESTFTYKIPAENGKTSEETFDLLIKSCTSFVKPAYNHVICTEMSSLWNMHMLSVLGSSKGSIDIDVYSDFAKLLATSSNVESADIPSALQRLAQQIAKDIKKEDFKSMTPEDAQEWLQTSDGLAGHQFRKFMKRHGHRCLKEFDVHSSPWYMDTKPLIETLQNMVGSCGDAKEKQEDSLSTLLPQLSVPLNLKSRLLLRFLLPNCRRGVRDREACKNILIKSADNLRKGFRHLSKIMVAEGYIPDKELLFFMTIEEIRSVIQTRNPRLIARANQRRKLFPTLDNYLFPEIFKGLPIPMNENEDEETEYVADLTMKGIPVSQGTIKAYARVALSLQEAAHLKQGEILITYSTDIGWSPYFPILSGVVTELGGLISHGAVVSREYGLPCVVGLHGATKQFKTGDYVFLDGNKGILQRLTPPDQ